MSKQICLKSTCSQDPILLKAFEEVQSYLDSIGFTKIALFSVTDIDTTYRSFLFTENNEKVLVEYKRDMHEEIIKLIFNPLEIKFVYEILSMKFRHLLRDAPEKIYMYEE